MSWLETFRTGLNGVRTHRLRSGLTVLGILIGIAAVILTVGLGEGAQAQVSSEITSLGTNLLTVSPGSSTSSAGVRGGFGTASTLTTADATALSSKTVAPDIKAVAPTTSSSETLDRRHQQLDHHGGRDRRRRGSPSGAAPSTRAGSSTARTWPTTRPWSSWARSPPPSCSAARTRSARRWTSTGPDDRGGRPDASDRSTSSRPSTRTTRSWCRSPRRPSASSGARRATR